MAPDCVGGEVKAMLPKPGEVLLLENLRYHAEEEANDAAFSKELAALCDVYVNDAFGSAHRAHASTEGITEFVSQSAAGLLMDKELEYLTMATKNPPRPCVAILGGAKVSDKIEVIENLMKFVDRLMVGGAMAYTFLKAKGEPTGKSLVEEDKVELAARLMAEAGDRLLLPTDHVVAAELKEGADCRTVKTIPDGTMGLDIGAETVARFSVDKGTVALAKAVAESSATSVVGGGDSEKAVKAAGVADRISHISTGGGASLEFLSGLELPGVAALSDK
jgi:phosphoglycerate kinase